MEATQRMEAKCLNLNKSSVSSPPHKHANRNKKQGNSSKNAAEDDPEQVSQPGIFLDASSQEFLIHGGLTDPNISTTAGDAALLREAIEGVEDASGSSFAVGVVVVVLGAIFL